MTAWFNAIVLAAYFFLPIDAHADDQDFVLPVQSNEMKIMSYNVQNLFDAEHDNGKLDYEFLPKDHPEKKNCFGSSRSLTIDPFALVETLLLGGATGGGKDGKEGDDKDSNACSELDWTNEKIQMKFAQIAQALAAQGPLPDVLVLVEVENEAVVGELASYLGYEWYAMTNSPDNRGIDVAMLYNEQKFRTLDFYELEVPEVHRPTRNIAALVMQLNPELGGGILTVFGNHWPSQGGPTEARIAAANALRYFVDDLRSAYAKSDFHFLATGDFNTVDGESPHPINDVIYDPKWDANMGDMRAWAQQVKSPYLDRMPRATYYYGVEDAWNEFDRFMLGYSLFDGVGLDADPMSYRVHAPDFLSRLNKRQEKIPFRYNHKTKNPEVAGYSDHFGIVMKLHYGKQ